MLVTRNMNTANNKKVVEKQIDKKVALQKMNEKAARAEKAARVWNSHPLFEGELAKIKEAKARQNAAINLTNQARYMKLLNEQETSSEFQRMAPANMMRLVQLTMTNLNRGNVFAEYAMETARDAIYYVKPFFSKSIGDPNNYFANRASAYDGSDGQDPFGFGETGDELNVGGYNGTNPAYGGKKQTNNNTTNTSARKAVYETVESRFANELANVKVTGVESFEWVGGPFGENSEGYVPGYTKIYAGTDERKLVAIQDSNTLEYFPATEFAGLKVTESPRDNISGKVKVELDWSGVAADVEKPEALNAYGRFESETDYEGKHLGEVNLQMSVYELRPHRTSIGVSWTKLAEITLDASFEVQVDDLLLGAAADTIQSQMDYQAFKDAYSFARSNPATYTVKFDAAYSTATDKNAGTKDSYRDNAQTLSSAIELVSAALYSDIKRGAINNLVVGVSVAPYIKLNNGFEPKGIQEPTGVYKIGELDGVSVYKAPVEVIPDNEILCVYKNSKVENDVAIVYGTLVPFVSNQLQYPTFYTRAGLASFGDRAVLNRKYLGRIIVENLKDRFDEKKYFEAQ